MAKAVISSVLDSLLGKYVDGLGGDSLQVGLWSGELTLQNLTLKPHALAELQLPITVVKGSIKRIHVIVPWNSLGSASVQISIEGVYALVTPNTKLPSAEEIRQAKKSLVERQELLRQHDRLAQAHNQEGEDESTFVSRLMMRIVDNLQITLRDIHFRYEDNLSNPERPFACGLMLQSFSFHTTDAEGNDVFLDRTVKKERFLHKAATLAWFGVYWDRLPPSDTTSLLQNRPNIEQAMGDMVHAMCKTRELQQQGMPSLIRDGGKDARLWVVRPCNLKVRLTKNETTDFSRAAKFNVHTELNGLACALSREQYEDMLFLHRAFASRQAIESHFMSARCRPFHSAKVRPRAWWDYATRLVITTTKTKASGPPLKKFKSVRMRFTSVKWASDERRKYIEVFRIQLRKGSPLDPTTREAKMLSRYEHTYPVDVVMAMRNAAEDAEAKARQRKLEADKAAAAAVATQQTAPSTGGGSWYNYLFSTPVVAAASPVTGASPLSPSAAKKNGGSALEDILTAEGRASLKKAYDETVEQEKSHEVPASCNLFAIKIHLRRGQVVLYQTKQVSPFLVASLDASLAVNVKPTNAWEASCRVQHFEVLNGLAEATPFHTFCRLGGSPSTATSTGGKAGPCASLDVGYSTQNEVAVGLDEDDTITKTTSIRVRFTMEPVRLMVDPSFVVFLQRFFVSMLPAHQLDKVWSFATSSVSEWIFSDEEEQELYRQTVGRKTRTEFDVLVDIMAPVVVLVENIAEPQSPTVVVDFGRFRFKNEAAPLSSLSTNGSAVGSERLYWSTEMSQVNVLLGRLDMLPSVDLVTTGYSTGSTNGLDQVIEEFSIKFDVDSSVASSNERVPRARMNSGTAVGDALLTPNISARALLPRIVMKVSESQITSLGRIHSSLQAQLLDTSSMTNFDDVGSETDDSSEQQTTTVATSATPLPVKTGQLKEKYVMQLALVIGDVVLHLKETKSKDAFRLQVAGTSFDMAVFTSQTVVQARLRSLLMEDCLYDSQSKFFHLLSTGNHDSGENPTDDQDLISLDVTMFASDLAAASNPDQEADTVVSLRCSVLHVQWNPSSIALLYQILSAYSTALQSHAVAILDVDFLPVPVVSASTAVGGGETTAVASMTQANEKPPLLVRASLVQLSVTFNKDQENRQLVRLAIQDAAFEYAATRVGNISNGSGQSYRHTVAGHLGNFVATDLSLEKHELYSPLVGLDTNNGGASARSVASVLLQFEYAWSDNTDERSGLKLDFEPIRLVYYHQQLMELVDYLFEGILGAMVAETLATATRLLLTEEDGSVVFRVTAKRPTLILPMRLQHAAHWRLTSDALSLQHFPSSIIHYRGEDVDLFKRERIVSHGDPDTATATAAPPSRDQVSLPADSKRILLANVNIYCATETNDDGAAVAYHSVLRAPTNLTIDVDDLVSATNYPFTTAAVRALPRFTIRVRMDDVAFELDRWQYVAVLALIQDNFNADVLVASTTTSSATSNASASLRPTMVYAYTRTDLEQVTMQLIFEMTSVRFDLYHDVSIVGEKVGSSVGDLMDHMMASRKGPASGDARGRRRGRPIASLVGSKMAASINQLRDQWPSIQVRVGAFWLQDRATNCLVFPNNGGRLDAVTATGQDGVILQCEEALEVVYAWDDSSKKCKIDVQADQVHGVVVPEGFFILLDFFTVAAPSTPPASAAGRRKSLTNVILNEPLGLSPSDGDAADAVYDVAISLRGKNMAVAFPQDVYDAESEQIGLRADFKIACTWKPSRSQPQQQRQDTNSGSDLDIQSSLVVDGTGIELFSRNAKRQGCTGSSSIASSGSTTTRLVQIIEPCDVHVEVSDLFPHAGLKQQIVALKFSPVEVYVSYEDSCVVMDAIDSSTRSFQRHHAVQVDSATVSRPPSQPTDLIANEAASILENLEIHRYLTCDVGAMSLTFINDCDGCDMGLMQLQTQRCNFFLNLTYTPSSSTSPSSVPSTTLSGGGSIVTLISYYNPDTRDWHPMCSEWGLDVSVQGAISEGTMPRASDNELHVIISANHPLDLAVTHGLLEVIASAGGAWNRRSKLVTSPPSSPVISSNRSGSPRSPRRPVKAPCVIRNDTGLPLTFWMSSSSAAGVSENALHSTMMIVASGNVADLHYVHSTGRGCGVARKYASRDRVTRGGSTRLHLHLADAPFQPIHDIEFEQLGSRAFPLLDSRNQSTTRFTLNFHSQLIDGRIVLTVSSQIKVVSQLAMPIQLLVNDPTWASPVEIGVLYPHRESAVPVMASLATELRVRPLADAVYNWSAPIPIQTRSDVQLAVESTSSEASKSAMFCVAMALEQSLRVVSFAEPIVLVNKLPVELSFRVKSPLSGNREPSGSTGSSSSNRGSSTREKIAVGGKSGVWWTEPRHRPQFELSVNGCQTSRWIELARSANSNSKPTGEVVSVMLLRQDGRPFKLLIQIVEQEPTKSLHIFFYAEIWFINRTGLEFMYGNESESELYFPPTSARTLVGNAQIAAYSSSSESPTAGAPTVRLSMQSCGWSTRFTADPRRLSWQDECLTLKADGRRRSGGGVDSSSSGGGGGGSNMLYEFGIAADYSTRHFGSITTLISVIPRYLVLNQSPYTVLLLEDAGTNKASTKSGEAHHILAKGDTYALYWVSGTRSKVRTSVLGDQTAYGWSEAVSFDHVTANTIQIPATSTTTRGSRSKPVKLQLLVKQGSITQATMVIVISEVPGEETSVMTADQSNPAPPTTSDWDVLTIHTQLAGLIVTVADKPTAATTSTGDLFGVGVADQMVDENVARLTISRVTAELSASRRETSAKLNVMGVKVEDLLRRSKNPIVLRPVARTDSFSSSSSSSSSNAAHDAGEKCFLTISYLEKPHPKYRWVERLVVDVQDVRIATSMHFVDRLNNLTKETLAHFDSHAYTTTLSVFDGESATVQDENILEYFVTSDDENGMESSSMMESITGRKVYLELCEIAPVRVVVSFSREKGDVRNDPNASFWLSNLKFKIDNACLTLDAFKLTHAMATQEALVESLSTFYVKSVKSQALGLIESVQVTTLVTSAVTSGVSSLVSTILGKTDPSLALNGASQSFRYQFLTNNQLITKHSKLLAECLSTSQFMQQVKHLVYDWDSNHTGLEARGCVALGILNNSRHSLVVNVQLNDGAEIRVLPLGRKHLASVISTSSGGGGRRDEPANFSGWRSDRSMVVFAWGYTPTLLTSGDVYFTVQSNACNVFVTRKTARLKANLGYTTTFTHQEVQPWWSTNVVIVGDDLHGHVSSTPSGTGGGGGGNSTLLSSAGSASNLFGDHHPLSSSSDATAAASTSALPPVPLQPSESDGMVDDEYEIVFTSRSLGLIAKQSGPRNVIVRECLTLSDGTPSAALACGRISHGDTILTVNGVSVTNTNQFRDLVVSSPRPTVLRFRRTGERFNANEAYDLFGEKQPKQPKPVAAPPPPRASESQSQSQSHADEEDDFDLFGARG